MIFIKRIYTGITSQDGASFLVDRMWPRGIRKEAVPEGSWLRNVAPSLELIRWFSHDPEKWDEFQAKYRAELAANPDAWQPLLETARHSRVTLFYSARDTEHNNALVLKAFLDEMLAEEK